MHPLDLRTLALTVIVGGVLMLAAYGAVWAGVRRWMGKVAAARNSSGGGQGCASSGRGFARHIAHDSEGPTA